MDAAEKIIHSRRSLVKDLPTLRRSEQAAEGGCGVLGFAANLRVAGRHVLSASRQMHNRGNGKGGGIAMVGLDPAQARVDSATLRSHYLLQVALLDPGVRNEMETAYIQPYFELSQAYELDRLDDYRQVEGLEVRPPDVWRYFVRVKPDVLAEFAASHGLESLPARAVEDEYVYQNSFRLNRQFYASLGEQRAFVLSHGKNLSVLKIVGYAEQVVEYYRLEDQGAYVWIAHQRYPTKGRVWHPGGAHPFIGLNEALVHNGDFANYHAVSEYLRQRNIGQLFLTDTEVSVQLFDLWDRVYGYPLEITLEAMAPTSEYDYAMLPPEKQQLYRAVQRAHIHASPDGPWFFILARSIGDERRDCFELLGITDTSMLRPQVFALYENKATSNGRGNGGNGVQIGLIASERQAINACLRSLAAEDARFQPVADRYWAARGGSHTDGGAFHFRVAFSQDGGTVELNSANKFGASVSLAGDRWHVDTRRLDPQRASVDFRYWWQSRVAFAFDDGGAPTLWRWVRSQMPTLSWDELTWGLDWLVNFAHHGDEEWIFTLDTLNYLHDRRFNPGRKKPASVMRLVDASLGALFGSAPPLGPEVRNASLEQIRRVDWDKRLALEADRAASQFPQRILVLDVAGFPAEGEQSAASAIVQAYRQGWRRVIAYNWRGGRFAGNGLGPDSDELRLDLYGDVGDYAASGLDGAQVYLHGAGQDQVGQILKRGKLVIYGDAGQTFLYGAKGGEVYVLGSVAGRPLINAVGRPRAVINGTCLDYLAESFMAGDPLQGGGFVILNGVGFDESGELQELESPYPGGNLFSLASGGAIYLRDPYRRVAAEQLNGGDFRALSAPDWELIEPYLQENERLFGIRVEDLLSVGGVKRAPDQVYRKVQVIDRGVLSDDKAQ
jgi:glutamate synthase domain-containing protein 1/glutamate synthase domain-containing protein 3